MKVELSNGSLSCTILPFGATLQCLRVPDRAGKSRDVVLGYDTQAEYESRDGYLGACVGRFANRIAGAAFRLHGRDYPLYANDGRNHLHGGKQGFSHRQWTVEETERERAVFTLQSPDGDEGYPGNLRVRVTYMLEAAALRICYEAESDADTLCSLTNHSYFNLAGHQSGSIAEQELQLFSDCYTPVDGELIPTGEISDVTGTRMDFRSMRPIGSGYDHNFVLRGEAGTLHQAARVHSAESGITMTVSTTMPGMQLYTAGFLTERPGKGGCVYRPGYGFCMETQFFPDSPHQPAFPSAMLRVGEKYRHETVFSFGAE